VIKIRAIGSPNLFNVGLYMASFFIGPGQKAFLITNSDKTTELGPTAHTS